MKFFLSFEGLREAGLRFINLLIFKVKIKIDFLFIDFIQELTMTLPSFHLKGL